MPFSLNNYLHGFLPPKESKEELVLKCVSARATTSSTAAESFIPFETQPFQDPQIDLARRPPSPPQWLARLDSGWIRLLFSLSYCEIAS